jgi:hypothetical protein
MNSLFAVLFLFMGFSEAQIVMEEFHQLKSEIEEAVFITKYRKETCISVQAYVCAVEMKQAEYVFNPFTKLKIFKKTKRKLNLLIDTNPKNIDLRYIRLLLQERTPSILRYNDTIEEDKAFLLKKIDTKGIYKELQVYIYNNTSL